MAALRAAGPGKPGPYESTAARSIKGDTL